MIVGQVWSGSLLLWPLHSIDSRRSTTSCFESTTSTCSKPKKSTTYIRCTRGHYTLLLCFHLEPLPLRVVQAAKKEINRAVGASSKSADAFKGKARNHGESACVGRGFRSNKVQSVEPPRLGSKWGSRVILMLHDRGRRKYQPCLKKS